MNILLDSSSYYERLKSKRHASTTTTPLSCYGHPFFEDFFPNLSDNIFHNELFSNEGDIFHECPVVWPALRPIIINGLFEPVQQLEKYMIIDVPSEILEEVAEIAALAGRTGVKVD